MTTKYCFEFHGLHYLSHHWRLPLRSSGRFLLCLQAFIGFLLFSCISDAFAYLFKKADILLPGSVAGLIVLVIILFVSPTEVLVNFLQPGSSLLLKWLSVFYVPALVVLPLSLQAVPTSDYAKLIAIQIGGVLFVGSFSGWCLIGLIRFRDRLLGLRPRDLRWESDDHHAPNHSPHQELLLPKRVVALMMIAVLILAVLYGVLPNYSEIIFFLVNTIALPAFFIIGQYLHIRFPRLPIPHPLITSTAASIGLISILGAIGRKELNTLLKSYSTSASINAFTGISSKIGPGNIYLYILNAAIVSMALPINSQKPTFISHGLELFSASSVVSFSSIILTIIVARLLRVSPAVIRSIPLRTTTTPIAIATVGFVGGNSGIAGVMSVTTGIIGGAIWVWFFNLNRFTKPITRGFAMGSMAQGLGTAIITAEEPESAPFSSLSFVVVGVMSSVWIAIQPVRTLIESMIE